MNQNTRNKSQNALHSLEVITEKEETRDKDSTLIKVYESDKVSSSHASGNKKHEGK